jgi:hypothetical protein
MSDMLQLVVTCATLNFFQELMSDTLQLVVTSDRFNFFKAKFTNDRIVDRNRAHF